MRRTQIWADTIAASPGRCRRRSKNADGRLAGAVAAGSQLPKAVVGGPDTIRAGLERFVAEHRPDEIILTARIFDQAQRVRSLEIAS